MDGKRQCLRRGRDLKVDADGGVEEVVVEGVDWKVWIEYRFGASTGHILWCSWLARRLRIHNYCIAYCLVDYDVRLALDCTYVALTPFDR